MDLHISDQPVPAPWTDPPPPPPPPAPPRRGVRTALLAGGAACLAVATALLGVLAWDLDGRVSDLRDENEALTAENASLDGKVSDVTAERDSLREIFPITEEAWGAADLEGTYEFLFVPVEGQCTYSDCDQMGSTRFVLSISRAADGYGLSIEGVPGPPAPLSRDGVLYSASGVLPGSLWSTCDDIPGETSFEIHLAVASVGLAGTGLRMITGRGSYRQYTPASSDCALAESTSSFTARRMA